MQSSTFLLQILEEYYHEDVKSFFTKIRSLELHVGPNRTSGTKQSRTRWSRMKSSRCGTIWNVVERNEMKRYEMSKSGTKWEIAEWNETKRSEIGKKKWKLRGTEWNEFQRYSLIPYVVKQKWNDMKRIKTINCNKPKWIERKRIEAKKIVMS